MANPEEENLQRIFIRLQDCLKRDRAFTRQGLNRTTLAGLVRTNEKYLVKAVRLCTGGKSVGDYLDNLRIEYACLLLESHPEYTVDAVATECGMSSRSAFYRTFRKYLCCSPCEYRDKITSFPKNGITDSR